MKKVLIENIKTDEIAPFLQKMVQIPTVNPPGDEIECARIVAEKLKELGFEVNLYEAEEKRTNVVGILKGSGGGKNFLLYSGHLDVVTPGEAGDWKFEPFCGKIEDGKILGRGTADHKGTVAASLFVMDAIIKSNIKLKGDLIFVAAADEEMLGRKGADFLVQNKYVYGDTGLVATPKGIGDNISIASMGYLWAKITIIGKQAHAGNPEDGVNAIYKAADLIKALQQMEFKKQMRLIPTKGSTGLLSVTIINSGVKTNIIPGKAEIFVERRLVPGEIPEEALSQIEAVISDLRSKDKDFHADIEVIDADIGTFISESEPIIQVLQRNISDILCIDSKISGSSGISDSRHFINKANIPMASWGIGGYDANGEFLMHAPNEYIYLSELIDFAKVLAATIIDICGYDK